MFVGLRSIALLVTVCCLVTSRAAHSQPALQPITIAVTSITASDWPTYVAERYGFFANNGLKPDIIVVGSSAGDAQQLAGGSVDIAEVTTTQLVEAVQGGAPMVGFINRAAGVPYFVIGKKGLTTIAQLKGKLISIGGPTDITRIFMDTILTKNWLKPGDWTYTFSGSTGNRFAALVAGAIDATFLFPPFSARAISMGYPVIDEVPKYFPNFPFDTWALRRQWGQEHPQLVTAFVRAHLEAVRWLYDPANRQKAVALLSEKTNTSLDESSQSYDIFIKQVRYFSPSGAFTASAFKMVLDAMQKMQLLKTPVRPDAFYDNRYVDAVNAQLKR
jgi:NitT/TauT family transport system substrate-binding protein